MVTKKLTIVIEADKITFPIIKLIEAIDCDDVKFISLNEEEFTR